MFISPLQDVIGITHDKLESRFKDKPDSLLGHLDHSKVAYNNDLRKLVAVSVASQASFNIQSLSSKPFKVPALKPADYAGDGSLLHSYAAKVAKDAGLDTDQVAAAISQELSMGSLKEIYQSLGQDHIQTTLDKSRSALSPAFNGDTCTKQMCFIVVINETDYAFQLTDQYDMTPAGATSFGRLYPKEVGKDDTFVSWGVWSTGSGNTSGAASSIKVSTTLCPPGGSDFSFIASSSCPAWTATNTLALKVYGGDGGDHGLVVKECKDNESISSQARKNIDAKSPDGRCYVTASLEQDKGKRAFVVVRITYYQVSERSPSEAAFDGNLFNSTYGPPSLRTIFTKYFQIGKAPNSIPGNDPVTDGPERQVWIVTHDIPDLAKSIGGTERLNMMINESYRRNPSLAEFKDKPFPNPGYHWGIVVGNYLHELNVDFGALPIVYQNRAVKSRDGDKVTTEGGFSDVTWEAYDIGGTTSFNDEAIRQAGEEAIQKMKHEYGEIYDPWNNNCQVMVKKMLATICKPGYKSFNGIADSDAIQRDFDKIINV